ncbi:MAG: ABC transporter permease [Phycisphaeraceae bacterium]
MSAAVTPPPPVTPDATPPSPPLFARVLNALGAPVIHGLRYFGGVSLLTWDTLGWIHRSLVLRRVRFGRHALYAQLCRLGARAIGVVLLVNFCIGLILALQMAPTLDTFGQTDKVANVIGIAMLRELGPLISAVVLIGFAGASIAAELGTMVVGEEIEALRATALDPVRFLIVPRIIATTIALMIVCVMGELVALFAGWCIGVFFLDIPSRIYIDNTLEQVKLVDFTTGLAKAGVFGVIIGAVASYNGLNVREGAAAVGQATTNTVVHCIVWVILTDMLFTAIFYRLGLV